MTHAQHIKTRDVKMKIIFKSIFFLVTFFYAISIYASSVTSFDVTLPSHENICSQDKEIIESAKIDRIANDSTGYKLCAVKLDRMQFDKVFSHCYLTGQHFEAFLDRAPEFTCKIDRMVFDGVDSVVFVGSGVVKSGYCQFACLQKP